MDGEASVLTDRLPFRGRLGAARPVAEWTPESMLEAAIAG